MIINLVFFQTFSALHLSFFAASFAMLNQVLSWCNVINIVVTGACLSMRFLSSVSYEETMSPSCLNDFRLQSQDNETSDVN